MGASLLYGIECYKGCSFIEEYRQLCSIVRFCNKFIKLNALVYNLFGL